MGKKKAGAEGRADGGSAVGDLFDGIIAEILVEDADYMRVGPFKRKVDEVPCGQAILSHGRDNPVRIVNLVLDRIGALEARAAKFAASRRSTLDYQKIWQPRRVLEDILRLLLRRKMSLDEQTVVRLIRWPVESPGEFNPFVYPFRGIASVAENYAEVHGVNEPLQMALEALSDRLRHIEWPMAHPKEWRETADRLEALVATAPKRQSAEAGRGFTPVAEQLLDDLIDGWTKGAGVWEQHKLKGSKAGRAILALKPTEACVLIRSLLPRLFAVDRVIISEQERVPHDWTLLLLKNMYARNRYLPVLNALLVRKLPLENEDLAAIVRTLREGPEDFAHEFPLQSLIRTLEYFAKDQEQLVEPAEDLRWLRQWLGQNYPQSSLNERLDAILGGRPFRIEAGESWSDAALSDLQKMKAKETEAWSDLLEHCQAGGRGKLSERWRKEAESLLDAVGLDVFKGHILRWFPLVDKPRTDTIESRKHWSEDFDWIRYVGSINGFQHLIIPSHVELLRGLAWCAGLREDADLARALSRLAISAYRKIPHVGPRLVTLGNACVTALGMMPGPPPIGQLAILKTKVKSGPSQKEIEKAFNAAAARENLPREEIEELAVPSYGLEEVGVLRQSFGDCQAELTVDGSGAVLSWHKQDKPIKSIPAAVKQEHAAELKELQTVVKDISSMVPAQRERLDTLFLSQKQWPLNIWRERFLDHPLVGTLARRLIWTFTIKDRAIDGIWHNGALVGANSKPLNLKDEAIVSLWHPISQSMEEVIAWRDWLERREVVQPFKQAHREVYLLTDAERRTRTYSNRFASHVLRQHQFHALCAARGWKNKLRMLVDAEYPPAHRLLPAWRLRAEYWIEGVGDDYGRDTNEAGAFLYLTTDQVRFYALAETDEPLPLETIPPLVFSEVLHDVDLFVGVASVGNDPNWSDGGPEGRYRDYWQSYSFGDLSATAQTRRALLERLLPRLKIADRCSLTDRFLHVRGELRGYKIHLGSGNILMTPNDQYLCIVPKQATAGHEQLLLPFEGDGVLSVILSKAFLLAEDTQIRDPSITSQIKR
jgi:hypothetical protein